MFLAFIERDGQFLVTPTPAAGVGFKSKTASWQQTRVTFGDELRESSEKDPNIEAVGIGGQIYGKRADMILIDDAVTLSNANDFERQIKWLTRLLRMLNRLRVFVLLGTLSWLRLIGDFVAI